MARDILELEFQMESGRELPVLTRFEGPITIALTGQVPPTAPVDLARADRAVPGRGGARHHGGAARTGLDHHRIHAAQAVAGRGAAGGLLRGAECGKLVGVPGGAADRQGGLGHADLAREGGDLRALATPRPQEVRDCLHEELAQALGPLNDLYELSDSVFNDDNFHTVLTGFDMLVLRVHYAPELANGMTRAEVAAKLPALLARLNPRGQFGGGAVTDPTPRAWIDAIETALGPSTPLRGPQGGGAAGAGHRPGAGLAGFAGGLQLVRAGAPRLADEMDLAVIALAEAAQIYRTLPGAAIHLAHIDMQMAAFALSAGQPEEAIRLIDRSIPAVIRGRECGPAGQPDDDQGRGAATCWATRWRRGRCGSTA